MKIIYEDKTNFKKRGRNNAVCCIEGCSKPSKCRQLCSGHYHRYQRYGDPLGKSDWMPQKQPLKYCKIDQCGRIMFSHGYCGTHFSRFKRLGNPFEEIPIGGFQTLNKKRYKRITCHGHPLANSEGRVPEHRYVLFAFIGDGTHQCDECGIDVIWNGERWKDALVVDHADFDRHNNELENLRPSCDRCNSHRWNSRLKEVVRG